MHDSRAVFLVSDEVRAVLCNYHPEYKHKEPCTCYEDCNCKRNVMFKTLDASIQPKDYVVVPSHTRHKMTIVQVVEADVEPDLDSDKPVKWIVGKVSRTEFEQLEEQEKLAVDMIRKAEKRRRRAELQKQHLATLTDDEVATLQIGVKSD